MLPPASRNGCNSTPVLASPQFCVSHISTWESSNPLALSVAWEDPCHIAGFQQPPDFSPPIVVTCRHSLYEWRTRHMQGRKAKLTKFWKSGSWVRAMLNPSGIYKCFTTHHLTIWHFGDYNHPLFILCSRSLWDLNESWRIQSDDNRK